MRGIMLGSALAALAILPPRASVAATERWCAVINLGSVGPAERCGIPSFEACRAAAAQYGPSSFCRPDNWAAPAPTNKPSLHKRRRHAKQSQ